jgi:hypothetical protein
MLHKLILENFMNIEYAEYEFYNRRTPTHRSVQVTGGMGAGKTRLLQAICFALAGQDLSGDTRPHNLISSGKPVGLVRAHLCGRKEIQRSIIRSTRSVEVLARQSGTVVADHFVAAERVVGLTRYAAMAAMIPGYFMRSPTSRKSRIYDEVFGETTPSLPGGVRIQRHFNCRMIDEEGNTYLEFSPDFRREVDLHLCYAINRDMANSAGLVMIDNYEPLPSGCFDLGLCPTPVQFITTHYVKRMPLEIRF